MNKVLVLGATGMLGSHLLEDLRGKYELLAIGRREHNILPNIDYKFVDLRDTFKTAAIISEFEPDVVVMAAANAAEGTAQHSPIEMITNGYNTFFNVIVPAIKTKKMSQFIYISSAAVYGNVETPYRESQTPKPHDIYAITKYANELSLKCLAEVYGFNYTIIRPHNIVGERQDITDMSRNVVVLFMQLMRMGVGPKIFGDGSSSRCYTYVKDVTGIIAKCIGRTDNLTLNVGSEKTTSIKELYEEIKKASGLNVEAQYVPERSRDVEKNSVDHTLTKELFDYEETPFDEIIADTWEWVDKQPMVMPKMKEKEIV